MKTETKEVYKCDHCRKLYQVKSACIKHEPKCRNNPENHQRCMDGCSSLIKKEITYYQDLSYGERETKREILFCEAKNEGVHPYWINGICSDDIDGEIPNNPMPKECDVFNI